MTALRHGFLFGGRGIRKIRRAPEQLVDVTFQPILLLAAFDWLFGGAIAGSTGDYLRRLVPGLMVLSVVMSSVATGVGLNTDLDTGVFDRFRSMPVARSAPLLGAMLADVVRYLLAFVVLLVTGTLMGFRPHAQPWAVLGGAALMVAAGLCFCWITVLIGMLARQPDSVRGVAVTVLLPLTFASDVFVPATTMPGWLRAWVRINPVSLLTDAMRGLLNGGPQTGALLGSVGWLAGIATVFFPLTMLAYRRRLG